MEISTRTATEMRQLLILIEELEKAHTQYNEAESAADRINRRLDLASAIGRTVYRARSVRADLEYDEKHQPVPAE